MRIYDAQARKVWGSLINTCRNITRLSLIALGPDSPEWLEMKEYLRVSTATAVTQRNAQLFEGPLCVFCFYGHARLRLSVLTAWSFQGILMSHVCVCMYIHLIYRRFVAGGLLENQGLPEGK